MPALGADILLIALTASWPLTAWWAWREASAVVATEALRAGWDGAAPEAWPASAHGRPTGARLQSGQDAPAARSATTSSAGSSGNAGNQTSMRVPPPGMLLTRRPPPSPSAR